MNQTEFDVIFSTQKQLNKQEIVCCLEGEQKNFDAHAVSNSKMKFRVCQNRAGHKNKNKLTYLLFYRTEIVVRLDYSGQAHRGIKTPHVHLFDERHQQGRLAEHLKDINPDMIVTDIVSSFKKFLEYNNFDLETNSTIIKKPKPKQTSLDLT